MSIDTDMLKKVSGKYCPRFGQIALEMGFITENQMVEAFRYQHQQSLSGQEHHLLGNILLDRGWMTSNQVEEVLNSLFRKIRLNEADIN